jgi:hypothetical protein
MGRWCSTKFPGKGNHSIRFISAYRCVKNIHGPLSVWNQQRYLLDLQHTNTDPIEKFDEDLFCFLRQCLEAGETIVLGIDANTDTRSGAFPSKLYELGLINIFLRKFGSRIPPTYARGSLPIDSIYTSASLQSSRAGFLKIYCDHRILWIDIPQEAAFGRHLHSNSQTSSSRLQLQDPRVVTRYTGFLESFLTEHQILSRLERLQQVMASNPSAADIKEYNQIDAIRTKGILLADKKCRKLRMGHVPFSPRLVVLWQKIRAWQLVLRKCRGAKIDSKYMKRVLKAADIADISLITESDASENLNAVRRNYMQVKREAASIRSTWLEEVATARLSEGNLSIAQEIRNLTSRERQRQEARTIRNSLSGSNRKALCSIEVPADDGSWMELSERTDIERALHSELASRFNQAATTPFCQEPLRSEVGPCATTTSARDILSGTYTPDNIDYWAAQLIPFLKQEIPTTGPTYYSIQQHIAGWKRVKERTSAGPSGITIPHMKAHGRSFLLSNIDTIMSNLPYVHGFSPSRWRKGLDVMLEKKPGIRKINTLRAILLYEADFNQNNKCLGREMLYRAEDYQAVAREQFGSRKNLSATDQSLNMALTFDIWRQLRQNGALCSNDAKSCYDRIVHNCASLCMQRIGTPIQPIISMFQTIQQLSHHVRTVFGESLQGYTHTGDIPIQGVGQGNGAGPQIWALVSTPVLNMLRSKGLGAKFTSSISHHTTDLVGYAFVDDTDLVASKPSISPEEVNVSIQNSLTAWEGGIRATGGAIVPEKSHWYLVDFGWKDGVPFYQPVQNSPGTLEVQDAGGQIHHLRQLEPWEAVRTLGVRLAPDGNMDTQYEHMLEHASLWADKL